MERSSGLDSRIARIALILAAAVSVAAMVVAFLFPLAATDTLCRYAPMAEAFTVGDWFESFHPRFAVGGTVVVQGEGGVIISEEVTIGYDFLCFPCIIVIMADFKVYFSKMLGMINIPAFLIIKIRIIHFFFTAHFISPTALSSAATKKEFRLPVLHYHLAVINIAAAANRTNHKHFPSIPGVSIYESLLSGSGRFCCLT